MLYKPGPGFWKGGGAWGTIAVRSSLGAHPSFQLYGDKKGEGVRPPHPLSISEGRQPTRLLILSSPGTCSIYLFYE